MFLFSPCLLGVKSIIRLSQPSTSILCTWPYNNNLLHLIVSSMSVSTPTRHLISTFLILSVLVMCQQLRQKFISISCILESLFITYNSPSSIRGLYILFFPSYDIFTPMFLHLSVSSILMFPNVNCWPCCPLFGIQSCWIYR